jgi:hypothetical protein
MIRPPKSVRATAPTPVRAAGLAFLLGATQATAQTAPAAGEPTVSKNEIWRAMATDDPTDPSNPRVTIGGAGVVHVSPVLPMTQRYHWSYSRTDPSTGHPLEQPYGDPRRGQIDGYREQCVKLVSKMYDDDGLPARIPKSQFDNLEDQATEMVLACVNNLHLEREPWMKGIGAIVCEAHTGHCWDPGDIWPRMPKRLRRRGP